MAILINFFFIVIILIGMFQFIGWLFSLPGKIINWYYDNFHNPK